ncbi:MAG: hypothetical protein H6555_01040 [Lewinellaceae bacterium]|nr:hypothetical protein [Lewinellaceae bacterium]
MPRLRLKLTGFARFFIVMVILAPIAYLAASYYNGEDGWENIKRVFQQDSPRQEVVVPDTEDDESTTTVSTPSPSSMSKADMQAEIFALRDSLRAKEFEIRELQRQIRLLKNR